MLQQKHIYNKNLKCISMVYLQSKTICISKSAKTEQNKTLADKCGSFQKQLLIWGPTPEKFCNFQPHLSLKTSQALKLKQNYCTNMNISLPENWKFHYKLTPPLLHMSERLTIWQIMKLRAIQKSQFSNFSVNWEKFENTAFVS